MQFDVTAVVSTLQCTTPTDPGGEDEPYLWVFFAKLDGSTIRQRAAPAVNRLSASVEVHAGPGGHGNLGSSSAVSGSAIQVPPAVGRHETSLRPIPINIYGGTQTVRVFVPGSLLAFALVIEEDAVPAEAPIAACAAVREHLQARLNDVINEFDLAGPILGVAGALSRGEDPVPIVQSALMGRLVEVQQAIAAEATALAIERAKEAALEAADWWNPVDGIGLVVAAIDPDDVVGAAAFSVSEQSLVSASLAQPFRADVRESDFGLGGAWYVLRGGASGSLRFFPGDFSIALAGPPKRKNLRRSRHVIRIGRRCLEAGTTVRATRVGFTEVHAVSIHYPFLAYRFFIDDIPMIGDAEYANEPGSVSLPGRAVAFPEFDDSKFYLVGERVEVGTVVLSFERSPDALCPQLTRLLLTNRPEDGCWSATLRIEGVLPNGQTVPVGTAEVAFTGQIIELSDQLLERYVECTARHLQSLHVRVKPSIPAQWRTPEVRWQRFESALERIGELQRSGLVDQATVARLKPRIARKFGLG